MQLTIITSRGMTSNQQQRVFRYTAVDETDPQTIQFHQLSIVQTRDTWYLAAGTIITLKTFREAKTTDVLGIITGEDALLVSEYEAMLPGATVPVISQERRLWLEALAAFDGEGIVPRSNVHVRALIAPTAARKELLDHEYPFISTPSHGYIRVPAAVIDDLDLHHRISAYSPRHGDFRFLEEDCDAYKFICALAEALGKTRHDVRADNFDHVEQPSIP